jgi:hypothetical protein
MMAGNSKLHVLVAAQATIQGKNQGEKPQGTASPEAAKAARTRFHDYF